MKKSNLFLGIAITIFIIACLILSTPHLSAKEIPISQAQLAAKNFYYERALIEYDLNYEDIKVTATTTVTHNDIPLIHIFDIGKDEGFVIIAGDDRVVPVLGYSLKGGYVQETSAPPPALEELLSQYEQQIIDILENQYRSSIQIDSLWQHYTSPVFAPSKGFRRVVPLIETIWDQDRYYNAFCPEDPNGADGHARVGCVAVAMAQIMRYHKYPEHGTGSNSYYYDPYGWISADFGNATYNWDNMPNYLTDYNDDVALIGFHCGVSVEMMYGPEGSGAYSSDVPYALINYFNYASSVSYEERRYYSDTQWENLLQTELSAKRPVYYSGSGSGGGHAFVCDGYNGSYFHFNWGWGGLYNGYFYLSSLNPGTHDFNWLQAAVVGIKSPLLPVADFSASATTILPGESIDFYDLSEGIPNSWIWSFDGGTPATSSLQNPTGIMYSSPGTYDVSLSVGNTNGIDDTLKSAYITVSDTALPIADFTISSSTPTLTETVYLTDSSLNNPYEWQWSFYPDSVTFLDDTDANSQNIAVRFDAPGNYSVFLTATNENGSDIATKFNVISAGGSLLPFTEDFEIAIWKDKWTIENPDLGITWDGYYKLSGNLPSRKAAWLYFYDYYTTGERDRLISPLINLSSYDSATLNFRHAYAIYNTTRKDSLIIYISTDNGNQWERIFAATDDGAGSFATHPPTTQEFIPTQPEDWSGVGYGADPITIDLSPWAGNANVKIMFESYNGHGNSLYIDDLMITSNNYPPTILWFNPPLTEFTVPSDTTITFTLAAYDANDEVSYSWLLNGEEQGIEDSLWTYTFEEPGEYEIQALVTDDEYEGAVIWNIEVLPDVGVEPPYPSSITMLKANYPNPFQFATTINYSLSQPQRVKIQIYNIRGQLVEELLDQKQAAGEHAVSWHPDNLSSGIYFYRLETATKSFIKKMVLIK